MKIYSLPGERWKNQLVYFFLSGLYFKYGVYSSYEGISWWLCTVEIGEFFAEANLNFWGKKCG